MLGSAAMMVERAFMALVLTCTAGSFNTRSSCREKMSTAHTWNCLKILNKLSNVKYDDGPIAKYYSWMLDKRRCTWLLSLNIFKRVWKRASPYMSVPVEGTCQSSCWGLWRRPGTVSLWQHCAHPECTPEIWSAGREIHIILAQVLDQYSKDSHTKNMEVKQNHSGSGAIQIYMTVCSLSENAVTFYIFTCHTFSTDTRQVLTLISWGFWYPSVSVASPSLLLLVAVLLQTS